MLSEDKDYCLLNTNESTSFSKGICLRPGSLGQQREHDLPVLAELSPATQQRFINIIDVLYEQNGWLFLLSEYGLGEMICGVEQQDTQRTMQPT